MDEIAELKNRIEAIEERNRRVEAGKGWEQSGTRVILIACMTYVLASLFLWLSDLPYPFLNSFVPAMGYVFSMQSLPFIKRQWIAKNMKKG